MHTTDEPKNTSAFRLTSSLILGLILLLFTLEKQILAESRHDASLSSRGVSKIAISNHSAVKTSIRRNETTWCTSSDCCRRSRRRFARRFLGRCCFRGCCDASSNNQKTAIPTWQSMFDGKTLTGWNVPVFGGDGEVFVEDGRIMLDIGVQLTGVTYAGELPKSDYEISLEAMRVEGIDFFCGLTFPVEESFCSLIVGGWAGAVVGLSNIDDADASQNETTRYMTFKTGQWYKIRVRVTKEKIESWIDDKKVVDQNIIGRRVSIRPEVELSQPLGFSAWQTRAALRGIKIRHIDH